jgi:hypothetical protein
VIIADCKRAWGVIAGALIAALLGACALVDTVDPRYDTINRSAAKARNEGILLNIVRASQNIPLNFITFSKVTGSGLMSTSAGLPDFGVGPPPLVSLVNRQALFSHNVLSGAARVDNTFDITLLETKEFYNGLLGPVDLPTLNFFVRQGYSRELLFWLFTASVRETIAGRTYEYRNDPDPALACDQVRGRRRCFSDMVDVALGTGLTVQTQTQKAPASGKAEVLGRLCFDPVLAQQARRRYPPDVFAQLLSASGQRPRCTDPWPAVRNDGATDLLTFEVLGTPVGVVRFEITTRSTFGIYQFLGRVIATGSMDRIRLRGHVDENEDPRLVAVGAAAAGGCFVDLFFESGYYCVPRQGAENTKRIFSLLAQLLALKTQPGDLAITPTFRAVQ